MFGIVCELLEHALLASFLHGRSCSLFLFFRLSLHFISIVFIVFILFDCCFDHHFLQGCPDPIMHRQHIELSSYAGRVAGSSDGDIFLWMPLATSILKNLLAEWRSNTSSPRRCLVCLGWTSRSTRHASASRSAYLRSCTAIWRFWVSDWDVVVVVGGCCCGGAVVVSLGLSARSLNCCIAYGARVTGRWQL